MRKVALILLLFAFHVSKAQVNTKKNPADEIKRFWFVLLTGGDNRSHDSATAAKIQEGHLNNINRLYNEGKIKVAGPFGEKGDWLGIFIFDCPTRNEVDSLLKTDPAIEAGRLKYQIKPWYTAPIGSFVPGKPKVTY